MSKKHRDKRQMTEGELAQLHKKEVEKQKEREAGRFDKSMERAKLTRNLQDARKTLKRWKDPEFIQRYAQRRVLFHRKRVVSLEDKLKKLK